jgi:hypothetical protein
VLGAWIGRGQKDARDYFLGGHSMPWWAVLGSIVASETSALTFLSVPGDAYRSGYTFLQLVFGYIVGRFAVAALLLPSYFQREIPTAYALLEARFGVKLFEQLASLHGHAGHGGRGAPRCRRFGRAILGIPSDAVVILAAATPHTFLGRIKAVIWIDLIQVFISPAHSWCSVSSCPGSRRLLRRARRQRRRRTAVHLFHFDFDLSRPHVLGRAPSGAFLTMSSHGADQLIVQRLLACRGLRRAACADRQRIRDLVQMTLFVSIGVMLFAFFNGRPIDPGRPAFRAPASLPDLHRPAPSRFISSIMAGSSRRRCARVFLELARRGLARCRRADHRRERLEGGAAPSDDSDALLDRTASLLAIRFSMLSSRSRPCRSDSGFSVATGGWDFFS